MFKEKESRNIRDGQQMPGEILDYGQGSIGLEKDKHNALRLKMNKEIDKVIGKFYKENNKSDLKLDTDGKRDEKITELWLNLRKITLEQEMKGASYDIDRAWNQKQVDEVFSIFNDYLDKENPSRAGVIGDSQLGFFLGEVFTTKRKTNSDTESKGKTVGDLFAKTIIKRLEGNENINATLQEGIDNWAQNIHMVDADILLDLLLAINQHPEKIAASVRNGITMGVGLWKGLVKPLNELAKEKTDFPSQLKSLEIFRILRFYTGEAGFSEAGEVASELLEEKTKDETNYFLNLRAKQIIEGGTIKGREKRLAAKQKYDQADLKSIAPEPLLLENLKGNFAHLKKGMMYSSLSSETGVIYNANGELDSCFDIKSGERLSLKRVLENDGFSETEENKEEYKNKLLTYKTLMEMPMRFQIEEEFKIELNNFSVREQVQFINFISNKSVSGVEEVKQFILSAKTSADRNNRFSSFLSLESSNDIGEKILEINNELKNKPEIADELFAKHAQLIHQINSNILAFKNLYQEIFFDKTVEADKLAKLFLTKSSELLLTANDNLKEVSDAEKNSVISGLLKDLDNESANKKNNLEELKIIAATLNLTYGNLNNSLLSTADKGLEELSKNPDAWLDKNGDFDTETKTLIKEDISKHKKYDRERVEETIELLELNLEEGDIDIEGKKIHYGPTALEKKVYGETINKYRQILPLQIALEKKVDQIVYGREDAKLPKNFGNFENEKVISESIPEKTPLYFPVGISKDLASWEAVFRGEKKAVKPIDIYGYLFWLNNQDRPVNLIVCDEIQANNYKIRFDRSETEAREKAQQIGETEARQYKKIIKTFGLNNINLQKYSEFVGQNKSENEHYQGIVEKLASHPSFKEAFLAMVQESVSGAEAEKYINYALEELTWILSTKGTKIGHLNEARYDILGTVIDNMEKLGQEKGLDVFSDLDSPESKIILNTVCKGLRDTINEKKSKLDKNSSALAYWQRLQDHLGKIKTNNNLGYDKAVKKESLALNFVCPEVGSASFGFRGDFKEKESVLKFKEPYSTYFYKDASDLLINSDQVVAAGEGSIGGKILTLDDKKQVKYAESVVRPILKHYFKSLEKAPASYFREVGKSLEELKAEGEEINSLLDSLRFIQRYIIKASELV